MAATLVLLPTLTLASLDLGAGGRADSVSTSLGQSKVGGVGNGVLQDPPVDQQTRGSLPERGGNEPSTSLAQSGGRGERARGRLSRSESDPVLYWSQRGGDARGSRNVGSAAALSRNDPRATGAVSDPVAFWHRLAQKRLRLLGARERRIVKLLVRIHRLRGNGSHTRRSAGASERSPASIICRVFGSHCREAQRVAWCESRYNVHATNGDYWGLFQFGSYARARYGFAWDAYVQARAAYRYFNDAGWAPWQCRP